MLLLLLSRPATRHSTRSLTQTPTPKPRLFSTSTHLLTSSSTSPSPSPSAKSIASSFLTRFQSLGPQTRTQVLDANQLRLLSLTLNRPSLFPGSLSPSEVEGGEVEVAVDVKDGTPLPPAYHLVYFTPAFTETQLGADGTDASYNPAPPFTRRMWAGGQVLWPRDEAGMPNPLRVGQVVTETTRVVSAEAKVVRRTGEEMVVVGVEKEFRNERGVAVLDRRNWVFRKALPTPTLTAGSAVARDLPAPSPPSSQPASCATTRDSKGEVDVYTRTHRQTPVTLFRFSALTFNAHKIHYSLPWARDIEGHRDLVVHGPLNLICILDLWRDIRGADGSDSRLNLLLPESIEYRATSPVYAEDEYRIVLEEGRGADKDGRVSSVEILTPGGNVGMKAEIRGAPSVSC